jgi:gamma-polyglutamate synthase
MILFSSKNDPVAELLKSGREATWNQLDFRLIEKTTRSFHAATRNQTSAFTLERQIFTHLMQSVQSTLALLKNWSSRYEEYLLRLNANNEASIKQTEILRFLSQLGATSRQLKGDKRAMQRWLDVDAVAERYDYQRACSERELIFLCERMGELAARLLQACSDDDKPVLWNALKLESVLLQVFEYGGDDRIRTGALASLRLAIADCGAVIRGQLNKNFIQLIYRAVLDPRHSMGLQLEAVDLISNVAHEELLSVFPARLNVAAQSEEEIFFHHRAAKYCGQLSQVNPGFFELLKTYATHRSPWVRQGAVLGLAHASAAQIQEILVLFKNEEVPSVAGQLLLELTPLFNKFSLSELVSESLTDTLLGFLASANAPYVLRTALHIAPDFYTCSISHRQQHCQGVFTKLHERIVELKANHERTDVRRFATRALERLVMSQPQFTALLAKLAPLKELELGRKVTIKNAGLESYSDESILRALAVLAQNSFGFDVIELHPHLIVRREYRWATRLWRVLYEWRNPASDKRQNHDHLRGRVYEGKWIVPADSVAELSVTKVPGEPLHISEEGGYRPYLPLVDQIISSLDQNWPTRPISLVTAEGCTEIIPPDKLWSRLKTKWRLSRDFVTFARLRNWTVSSTFKSDSYIQHLCSLGFSIRFKPHSQLLESAAEDSRVKRFFPAALPMLTMNGVSDFRDYFYSVFQNTLSQLLIFLIGMFAVFFGQHFWLNWQFRRARKNIPLVVGGWGTRGKSGTERLKAAVFSALGYQILSKTSGCEAMFLYGYPLRNVREMFLFRPYDKATIWEQVNLTRFAASVNTDVMLWECMGLNPRYVRILQHQWMRDDIATITNCYPDHEDIQGPAGIDLPQVIGQFMPVAGRCSTSEENMLPYLVEIARKNNTELTCVNWLEAGLIAPDVLSRFPYEEHPYNIALVVRMFAMLGVASDLALKEMADRVIPDLGVLKAYPVSFIDDRRIEFVNGCSANERHGTLSNWIRMGFDKHALDLDPEIWTCTVVNNRADRVARSQVFAGILVNDIGADRHFLIGGNLDGLQTYIEQSFNVFMDQMDWTCSTQADVLDKHNQLLALAKRWKFARSEQEADLRLSKMLQGCHIASEVPLTIDASIIEKLLEASSLSADKQSMIMQRWEFERNQATDIQSKLALLGIGSNSSAGAAIRDMFATYFKEKIVVVHDYHTTGNQLVKNIIDQCPPGLLARVMGIQNIKGTGLDFVYRWQAWNDHFRYCRDLLNGKPDAALDAARALSASHELGLLEENLLRSTLQQVRMLPVGQSTVMAALLKAIEKALDEQLEGIRHTLSSQVDASTQDSKAELFKQKAIVFLEEFLDAGDAIKRRHHANAIYRELTARRISLPRAVKELQELTKRQKGGWLKKSFS